MEEKKKKIYISGKITGEVPYKCRYKFGYAATKFRLKGYSVINPQDLFTNMEQCGFEYEDLMKMCFAALELCDSVYMLRDWNDSPGARREHEYALKNGKEVIYEVAENVKV